MEDARQLPVSIRSGGLRLSATLHLPSRRGRVPGVLLCHGFTGHRAEAHFLFVKTARALASAGLAALRVDFRGSGESGGRFEDMTASGEIADAIRALRYLASHPRLRRDRLGVLGLSLGGLVAAHAATRVPAARALVLWNATARPASLIRRIRIAWKPRRRGRVLDLGGLGLGPTFLRDILRLDPVAALSSCRRPFPVLVVKGSADGVIPVGEALDYRRMLSGSAHPFRFVIMRGADHTFANLGHEQRLISLTVAWLRRVLAG